MSLVCTVPVRWSRAQLCPAESLQLPGSPHGASQAPRPLPRVPSRVVGCGGWLSGPGAEAGGQHVRPRSWCVSFRSSLAADRPVPPRGGAWGPARARTRLCPGRPRAGGVDAVPPCGPLPPSLMQMLCFLCPIGSPCSGVDTWAGLGAPVWTVNRGSGRRWPPSGCPVRRDRDAAPTPSACSAVWAPRVSGVFLAVPKAGLNREPTARGPRGVGTRAGGDLGAGPGHSESQEEAAGAVVQGRTADGSVSGHVTCAHPVLREGLTRGAPSAGFGVPLCTRGLECARAGAHGYFLSRFPERTCFGDRCSQR